MNPAAWAFLLILAVVTAASVWIGTWPTNTDGCPHGQDHDAP